MSSLSRVLTIAAIALLSSTTMVFAQGYPYAPGATLDPSCGPGITGCRVDFNYWGTSGNTGTTNANFIGTTDNQSLIFRTNNTEAFRVLTNGNIGVGTQAPNYSVDLGSNTSVTGVTYTGSGPSGINIDTSGYTGFSSRIYRVQTMTTGYAMNIDAGAVTGLNDLSYSGAYIGGAGADSYTITIDGTGPTDTFSWISDSGSGTGVSITAGTPIYLADGISVTFAASTGHTLGDVWVVDFQNDTYQIVMNNSSLITTQQIPTNSQLALPMGVVVTMTSPIGQSVSDTWEFTVVKAGGTFNAGSTISVNNKFFGSQENGSLFLGEDVATPTVSNSLFAGAFSGTDADLANNSNFLGLSAGANAVNSNNSNFLGQLAGASAASASRSNFLGQLAGFKASSANNSNFFGYNSGNNASSANNANFFGQEAGYRATDAARSNFFGNEAGSGATTAYDSNFIGSGAGKGAENAHYSNFFGQSSGYLATDATGSNFIGYSAGYRAEFATSSNFIGFNSGRLANQAQRSNFFGSSAGSGATNSEYSNFIGSSAGLDATDAWHSNFFGSEAGVTAEQANNSNFFGQQAGYQASLASNSNFLGQDAGNGATSASGSNFLGQEAGSGATDADNSNFLGASAGQDARNAKYSNFFGNLAGQGAENAEYAVFVGSNAGQGATEANNSVFVGTNAGLGAAGAARSIFIGLDAGKNDAVLNASPKDSSILIGNYTSTNGFDNSIALGAYAENTAVKQFMIGSTANTPIDSTVINGSSGISCTITTGTGIGCSSDERLKTDITDLDGTSTLEKLLQLRTVTYHWRDNPDMPLQVGFIAQNMEQYFPELVATDSRGYKSVYYSQITPILTRAIQDIAQVTGIFKTNLIAWMGDTANGIADFVATRITGDTVTAKNNLCVGTVCVTENQFLQMVQTTLQNSATNPIIVVDPTTPVTDPAASNDTTTTDTTTSTTEPVVTTPAVDTPPTQ